MVCLPIRGCGGCRAHDQFPGPPNATGRHRGTGNSAVKQPRKNDPDQDRQRQRARLPRETFYVQKAVLLDEHDLKATTAVTNTLSNEAHIDFELSTAGKKRFADVTRQNIGRRLAIIIDGKICSAPILRCEIAGGKGEITGSFTPQEARAISDQINAALKR